MRGEEGERQSEHKMREVTIWEIESHHALSLRVKLCICSRCTTIFSLNSNIKTAQVSPVVCCWGSFEHHKQNTHCTSYQCHKGHMRDKLSHQYVYFDLDPCSPAFMTIHWFFFFAFFLLLFPKSPEADAAFSSEDRRFAFLLSQRFLFSLPSLPWCKGLQFSILQCHSLRFLIFQISSLLCFNHLH